MTIAKPGANDNTRADLAVVIVSWNVRAHLLKNLEALFASEGDFSVEVIVVDNASVDGTVEAVRSQFPDTRILANANNAGFAAANAQAMGVAKARHVLLLNPDMIVSPDALQKTVAYLDAHRDVAVVGARLLSPEGTVLKSVRRFPDVWSQVAIVLKLPHLFSHIVDLYLWSDFDDDREQSVDSVRGSYFAINGRALQELGGLDTRFFLWFEEVDYCRLAVSKQWKVMYTPTIRTTDLVGQSFLQTRRFLAQARFTRSLIQYFEKWQPWWQTFLLRAIRPIGLGLAWVADWTSDVRRRYAVPVGSVDVVADGPRATPRIAIQVALFRSAARLPKLIASLQAQTVGDWELFAYENSCDVDEAERVKQLLNASGVRFHFVLGETNVGFGAHNDLIQRHRAEFVLILNDDAWLAPDYLERALARFAQDEKCAAVSGLVLRDDEADPVIDTAGLEYRCLADVHDRFVGRRVSSVGPLVAQPVFGVSGAVALYRRAYVLSASRDGRLFAQNFFMYKEDVELALRLNGAGWSAWFEPTAVAFHPRTVRATDEGFVARLQEEHSRPPHLRRAAYRNQWRIYQHHWRGRTVKDLAASAWHEAKRSALVFVTSPVVFFLAWYDILRG